MNIEETKRAKANWALLALVCLSVLYFVIILVPGRFAVTDEVFFKAAGRNWAATGHFAAPEITGRLTEGPPLSEIYFAQPPLYTFLFGLYTKLVGFGPRACIAYDAIIHLLLVWSAVMLGRRLYGLSREWAVLCGVLILPLGTAGRPDELGIIFAMWSAIFFRSTWRGNWRTLAGGALMGLCACTSLGAAIFLAPMVMLEMLSQCGDAARKIRDCGMAAAAGLAVIALVISPILARHPSAYQQLIAHAGEQSAMLSAATGEKANSSASTLQAWTTAMKYGYSYGLLIAGVAGFAFLCGWFDTTRSRHVYGQIWISFASLAVLFFVMPGKYLYLWFAGCWLLVACVALARERWGSMRPVKKITLSAWAAACFILLSLPFVRWTAILWTLPPQQTLTESTRRLRTEIPAGVGVATTDYWWALADRNPVYDTVFSNPSSDAVQYVVLSGNGSAKPGTPLGIKSQFSNGFSEVDDELNTRAAHLGPIPLSHSAYGFGAYVLVKRN